MSSDTSAPILDSSPSNLMVESLPFDAILRLGCKLVEELSLDESSNTLSRWMAHYVAELIQGVESAPGERRAEMQSRCADAILNLWKHRLVLPAGHRPLEGIESVLVMLAFLGSKNKNPNYFMHDWDRATKGGRPGEQEQWLACAKKIDGAARILIAYCLSRAAGEEIDRSLTWAALAEELGMRDEIDIRTVRFLAEEHGLMNSLKLGETAQKELTERLSALDDFIKMAEILSGELRSQLKKSGESSSDDSLIRTDVGV